eukprot:GHVQ01025307.1.p1 GENE.GHVQ01025307.1~~GHVQ01025307.1.p1  ORF type:complete len:786 (-),score=103.06 GHVQ01025307.1:159-2516(-)
MASPTSPNSIICRSNASTNKTQDQTLYEGLSIDQVSMLEKQLKDLNCIPNLPGWSPSSRISQKESHHKKQIWGFNNSQRMEGGEPQSSKFVTVPRRGDVWRDGTSLPRSTMRDVHGKELKETEAIPAWEALEHKVLRFYGFFKEHVEEDRLQNYRVRQCIVYFYLEDDTMQVAEPKIDNSGIPQGTLVRRHRFSSGESGHICPKDLRVGATVDVYGKVMLLTDCDEFTRGWYKSEGMEQCEKLEMPKDVATEAREAHDSKVAHIPMNYEKRYREVMFGGGHVNENMHQFMAMDGKVCRFFAVHNNFSTPVFESRKFTILFFLCDDSVEIREMYPLNGGRDSFPVFYRRRTLPKSAVGVRGPTDRQLKAEEYFGVKDFSVGESVKMLNTEFVIYDADTFTRKYFSEQLGITLQPAIDVTVKTPEWPIASTPPPTGYGTEEDSLASVKHLIPKAPKINVKKMTETERQQLRYTAVFSKPRPEDEDREFSITYTTVDDCISIHEPPKRNSGFVAGRFLQKGKYVNATTNAVFQPHDLLVGTTVTIGGYSFRITEMDEYTRKFLEGIPPTEQRTVDLRAVLETLRIGLKQQVPLIRDVFRRFDKDKNGVITFDELQLGLTKFGFNLTDQEARLLMRHFDCNRDGQVSYNEFCDVVLDQDFSSEMLATKAKPPLDREEDEAYDSLVGEKAVQLKEAEAMRKAVRNIQRVFYQHARLVSKLIKEFVRMTPKKFVNSRQIQSAMQNIGHTFPIEDVERCIAFLMPKTDFETIDYVLFVQGLTITYYNLPADR